MPDGTVMVNGKIVDGIRGAPAPIEKGEEAIVPETTKDAEQDRKLASLQDKSESNSCRQSRRLIVATVAQLLRRTRPRDEWEDPDGMSTRAQATPHLPRRSHQHHRPRKSSSHTDSIVAHTAPLAEEREAEIPPSKFQPQCVHSPC